MEIAAFVVIFILAVAGIKLLGLVFKVGIFILTLPLLILVGAALALFFVVAFPAALVVGIVGLILSPLALFVLGPLVLIGLGLALILRR